MAASSTLLTFFGLFKKALLELTKNDPLRMAGATAFFTTFALPPILIILTQLLRVIFDSRTMRRQLFIKLSGFIGRESVHQVVETLIAFRKLADNWFLTLVGIVFLLFVATTLFKVIKSSLNQLWRVKAVKKRSFWMHLRTRSHALFLILMVGVLFLVGLLVEGLQALIADSFEASTTLTQYSNGVTNYILSVLIITLWFATLFRFLPDGKPTWRVALVGALVTSILFNTGKLIFRYLMLGYNNINNVYGASGAVVLLLLFVFYASLILYYGAAFTKIWGAHIGKPIKPLSYAIHYQVHDEANEE